MAVVLAAGCHKTDPGPPTIPPSELGIVPADPLVVSNLDLLTRKLRRTLQTRRLTRKFDEFVAAADIEVPPPPAGQKYAINKFWRVILVDANAK
jgi:hypothetical protein